MAARKIALDDEAADLLEDLGAPGSSILGGQGTYARDRAGP
jgi:hypothetical protein